MEQSYLELPVTYAVTKQLIRDRSARIGVVGLGYVGLPLGLLFSECGFSVEGFDLNISKVESLLKRRSYIQSIPSERVAHAFDRGFHATFDLDRIVDTDILIVCVPTPLAKNQEPDLRLIRETIFNVAAHLHSGHLVILESITCPGTTEEIVAPILEQANGANLKVSRNTAAIDQIFVAFSPEYEDHQETTIRRLDIPKVLGGIDHFSTELATDLYSTIFSQVVPVSTPTVAEMSKLLENAYRCVNVALVNEIKELCFLMGIDPWEVMDATKTMPSGFQDFYAGLGQSGNFIPTGPVYLSWKAKAYDFRARFIESAGEFNAAMPAFIVRCTSEALNRQKKSLHGSSILVLGVGYKKDGEDLRESLSLTVVELLRRARAEVSHHEPWFPPVGLSRPHDPNIISASIDDFSVYDAVLIMTDHSSYDFRKIVSQAKLVIDTRNATRGIVSDKIVRC